MSPIKNGAKPAGFSMCGAVAQLGEYLTGSQGVTSSILVSSTNKIIIYSVPFISLAHMAISGSFAGFPYAPQ